MPVVGDSSTGWIRLWQLYFVTVSVLFCITGNICACS